MFVCVYQQYQSDEYIPLFVEREGNMMRNRALRWTKEDSHGMECSTNTGIVINKIPAMKNQCVV